MSIRNKLGILLIGICLIGIENARSSQKQTMMSQTFQPEIQISQRRPDVVYVPTPQEVVDEMLELAEVSEDDLIYDLGSGDGRIPITAAERYGSRGIGIDIDPQRIQEAKENAREAEVTDRVEFLQQDLFASNIQNATVVTLYLSPQLNLKLRPQLWEQLRPGTRIVSHNFDMGDWEPDRVVKSDAGATIYLWIVPEEIPQ